MDDCQCAKASATRFPSQKTWETFQSGSKETNWFNSRRSRRAVHGMIPFPLAHAIAVVESDSDQAFHPDSLQSLRPARIPFNSRILIEDALDRAAMACLQSPEGLLTIAPKPYRSSDTDPSELAFTQPTGGGVHVTSATAEILGTKQTPNKSLQALKRWESDPSIEWP
ncbi:hypothetical protein QJS04_geneDACA010938 [Acorus gramineus]|uniref:Uncharacterized protein n=1 Tax=Acorus gramineus TaxID=55184 RepID=A0AAV9BH41_ACOGR|nr:hypothetical protein QJS04_geneDACA010938 [Acorus gramineus]